MLRQWLCVLAWMSQAASSSGVNHWNLLELFTLYPQLPSANETCPNGVDAKAGSCSGEGGESSYGDRGSHSSPDPEEDALWLWWFIKVWWLSLIKFTDSGLVWCGALCTSVGIAARWSYWLAVAVVGIFILQLLFWTITWVLCPFLRHVTAFYRYIRGHGGWHEVTTLQGTPVFRPKWVGPKGQSAWSAEFVQQEVRGRGENRDPFDLLVTDGVAITRLRHGTLRGRTNRSGYRLNGGTVHGASHRYFRNQIESYGMEIHLCSTHPCGSNEDDCVHITACATIPRSVELNLQEEAGRGPIGRCCVATWFIGCRCAPFSTLWKGVKALGRCCLRSTCCTRRRPREPLSDAPEVPKHLDSETESEGEGEATCQADQICHFANGKATPLSTHPCRDVSAGGPIPLLASDAARSNKEELTEEGSEWTFRACNHHRAMYELSSSKRRCVVDGCLAEAKSNRDGLKLCRMHATREERSKEAMKPKEAAPKPSPKKPSRSRSKARSEESELPEGKSPPEGETEARIAPGPPEQEADKATEVQRVTSQPGAEILGLYLKAILQGVEAGEALGLVSTPDCGPMETRSILKEAATAYLPKLPKEYPAVAKKALVALILDEVIEVDHYDPVLDLKPTQLLKTMSGSPSYLPAREAQEKDEHPANRYEEIGWQAFYRPKGAQSLPSGFEGVSRAANGGSARVPPDAQSAFAFAARPRHTGSFTDAEPRGLDETTKALQTIAKTLTSKDEAAGQDRGKLSSIGKLEERLVFLLRGCDGLTVPVGTATVGKELFQALQFPVNLNNRVAFGLASLSLGGKDTRQLPDHCLSAADFPLTSEEDFDKYAGTVDNKLEKRPKPPVTLSQWYRNALRQAWAVACVMGTEHYSTFESAATYLLKLGEEHSYMWPPAEIYNVWEELWARFVEELKEVDRTMRREMREDPPTSERIRFFATAQDQMDFLGCACPGLSTWRTKGSTSKLILSQGTIVCSRGLAGRSHSRKMRHFKASGLGETQRTISPAEPRRIPARILR